MKVPVVSCFAAKAKHSCLCQRCGQEVQVFRGAALRPTVRRLGHKPRSKANKPSRLAAFKVVSNGGSILRLVILKELSFSSFWTVLSEASREKAATQCLSTSVGEPFTRALDLPWGVLITCDSSCLHGPRGFHKDSPAGVRELRLTASMEAGGRKTFAHWLQRLGTTRQLMAQVLNDSKS